MWVCTSLDRDHAATSASRCFPFLLFSSLPCPLFPPPSFPQAEAGMLSLLLRHSDSRFGGKTQLGNCMRVSRGLCWGADGHSPARVLPLLLSSRPSTSPAHPSGDPGTAPSQRAFVGSNLHDLQIPWVLECGAVGSPGQGCMGSESPSTREKGVAFSVQEKWKPWARSRSTRPGTSQAVSKEPHALPMGARKGGTGQCHQQRGGDL